MITRDILMGLNMDGNPPKKTTEHVRVAAHRTGNTAQPTKQPANQATKPNNQTKQPNKPNKSNKPNNPRSQTKKQTINQTTKQSKETRSIQHIVVISQNPAFVFLDCGLSVD